MVWVYFNRGAGRWVLHLSRENISPLILYVPHLQYIHTISSKNTVFKLWKQMFAFMYFIRYNSNSDLEMFLHSCPLTAPLKTKNIWALTIRWLELCVSVSVFVCDWCLYTGVPRGEWTQSGLTLWSEPLLNSEQVGKYSVSVCLLYSRTCFTFSSDQMSFITFLTHRLYG